MRYDDELIKYERDRISEEHVQRNAIFRAAFAGKWKLNVQKKYRDQWFINDRAMT